MHSLASNTDRRLADVMPNAIVLVDMNSQMLWWNRAAERMFGFYVEGNQEKSLLELLSSPEFEQVFLDKDEHTRTVIVRPNRPSRRLSLQLRAYEENTWLVIGEDVTDVFKLRAMRQEFVANVSHELRTPLTVFCGYIEMLLEQPEEDAEALCEMLKQMSAQGKRMQNLINDLLWLSRLETKPDRIEMASVNMSALIDYIHKDALQLCKSSDKQLTFSLEVNPDLQLLGDFEELRSAFANIVSNAVRYTPSAGRIAIRWFTDNAVAKFQVQDTGLGIPEKYIPRITQRFYRTEQARSCEQGGTGLGLAIVKHVLLRNSAKLEIVSKVGVGSTFTCAFAGDNVVMNKSLPEKISLS